MLVICKVSCQTNEQFGRYLHVNSDAFANFSYGTLVNGFWDPMKPTLVEARCHFPVNFTTRFHKLYIKKDSKTPVEQPPSLGGTNSPEDLV